MNKVLAILLAIILTLGLASCGTNNEASETTKETTVSTTVPEVIPEPTPEPEPEKTVKRTAIEILIDIYETAGLDATRDFRIFDKSEDAIYTLTYMLNVENIEGYVGAAQTTAPYGSSPNFSFIMELESNEAAELIKESLVALANSTYEPIAEYKVVVKENFVLFLGLTPENIKAAEAAFNDVELMKVEVESYDSLIDIYNAMYAGAESSKLAFLSILSDGENDASTINNYVNQGEVLEEYVGAILNNAMMGPSILLILEVEDGSDMDELALKVENIKMWMICMAVPEYEIVTNGNYVLFAGLTAEDNDSLVASFSALELK